MTRHTVTPQRAGAAGNGAHQPILRIRRELSTSRSQPGRYTLTVRVRTEDDRRAERQTTLIVDPERD